MQDDSEWTGIRLDGHAIRVLAHPLRSRLLSELRRHGPATATGLAESLHTNTGATSYHLRKLESVGLVTDTGEGEGKRRLWRASTTYHAWKRSDFAGDEDATTASGWLERDYIRQFAARAEHWQDASESWPMAWVDAAGMSDTYVTVNPAQLQELQEELAAVFERFRHVGDDDPEARRVQVYVYAHPSDIDDVPEPC
jgi:DNA-binding transcriptional ArsR family regulator